MKFEYVNALMEGSSLEEITELQNKYGEAGWQLVGVLWKSLTYKTYAALCTFKREKVDQVDKVAEIVKKPVGRPRKERQEAA